MLAVTASFASLSLSLSLSLSPLSLSPHFPCSCVFQELSVSISITPSFYLSLSLSLDSSGLCRDSGRKKKEGRKFMQPINLSSSRNDLASQEREVGLVYWPNWRTRTERGRKGRKKGLCWLVRLQKGTQLEAGHAVFFLRRIGCMHSGR